jgi:hypothetical protein
MPVKGDPSETRREEHVARPAAGSRRVTERERELGSVDVEKLIAIGQSIESRSELREVDNKTLAIELAKLAAYGLSNGQGSDIVRVAAARLAQTNVDLSMWKYLVPTGKADEYSLVDSSVVNAGAIVTFNVKNEKNGLISVYICDQGGRLIEERVMSEQASREYESLARSYYCGRY